MAWIPEVIPLVSDGLYDVSYPQIDGKLGELCLELFQLVGVSSTLARVLLTAFPESAEHDALFYDPITKAEA